MLSRISGKVVLAGLLFVLTAGTCVPVVLADQASDDLALALGQFKRKRWDDAEKQFAKFLQENPTHPQVSTARFFYGVSLSELQNDKEARDQFRDFVRAFPNDKRIADARYRIGTSSFHLKDYKTAEAELTEYVEQHRTHDFIDWALSYVGDSQLAQGRHREAIATYQRVLKEFPTSQTTDASHYGLGRAYAATEKPAEALAEFNLLIADRQNPYAARAYMSIANLHYEAKQFGNAAQAWARVEQLFPGSEFVPSAALYAGMALYAAGDFDRAIRQLKLAEQHADVRARAGYFHGECYRRRQQFEQAAEVYRITAEAAPNDPLAPTLWYHRADCVRQSKSPEQSIDLFVAVADKWPTADVADESLFYAAFTAFDQNDVPRTQALIARLEKDYPGSKLRDRREILEARLVSVAGDADSLNRAAALLQNVVAKAADPRDQNVARYYLSRVLKGLGRHQDVIATVTPVVDAVRKGDLPELRDAILVAGASQFDLRHYAESITLLTEFLKYDNTGPNSRSAIETRAAAYAESENETAAEADLKVLADRYQRDARVWETTKQIAEIAWTRKKFDWSARLFGRLAALDRKSALHPKGLSGHAWSLYMQQDYEKAAQSFGLLVQQHPDDPLSPEASYMQGRALQQSNRLNDAVTVYQSTLKQYGPTTPPAAGAEKAGTLAVAYKAGRMAAQLLTEAGRVEPADAAWQDVVSKFPNAEDLDTALQGWGYLNLDAERFERSDEVFGKLVTLRPNSQFVDEARLVLAESSLLNGKTADAQKVFEELATRRDGLAVVREQALVHLVALAEERGDWNATSSQADRFLNEFPNSQYAPQIKMQSGAAKYSLDNIAAAEAVLEPLRQELLKSGSDSGKPDWAGRTWVTLAEIQLRKKNYEPARVLLEEFRKFDPPSRFQYQALEALARTWKLQSRPDFDQAIKLFQQVIDDPHGKRTSTAAKSQFMIGEIWLLKKDYQQALDAFERVFLLYKVPEWQAPAVYQAAQCEARLGRSADAAATYRELIDKFPNSEYAAKARQQLQTP